MMTKSFDYYEARVEDVVAITSAADLALCMRHYSGFIRQAAVERAIVLSDPAMLPAIIERLNDWVAPVRDAARAGIVAMLPMIAAKHFIALLPAIAHLRHAPRWNHLEWLAQFEREMVKHLSVDDLMAGLKGSEAKVARACFDLLRRLTLIGPGALVEIGLASRNDIVIGVQAVLLIDKLPVEERPDAWRTALESSFGAVRTIALRRLLEQPGEPDPAELAELAELAISFLANPQTSVRHAAIAYLLAHQFDVRRYYRKLLATQSSPAPLLRICLAALAGLRQPDDIELATEFSRHARASVRHAAYMAWLKLAPHAKDDIARAAVADDSARVRKAALDMVRRAGAYVPFDFIISTLTARRDWGLLLHFGELERWNTLEAIARIAIAAKNDAEVRPVLAEALAKWLRMAGSFTRPSAAQLAFLQDPATLAILSDLTEKDNNWAQVLELELSIAFDKRHG